MRSRHLLPAALVLMPLLGVVTAAAHRDPPLDDPRDNTLVEIGSEHVAIFPRSESPDGRFAFAWTLRPRPGHPPPDWSSYDRSHAYDWANRYRTPFQDSPGDYTVVNGLVDLQTRRFTPLDTPAPVAPDNLYAEWQVAWINRGEDFRAALVNAHAEGAVLWRNTGLWLVEVGAAAPQVVDLTAAANRSVTEFLQKAVPARLPDYWVDFRPGDIKNPGKSKGNSPKTWTLKLPFDADVATGDSKGYFGTLTLVLPAGTITGLTAK